MFFNFLISTKVFGLSLFEIFEFFITYGVIGWVFESCLVSFREKRWVNRGFLFGPFIPIYAFGVVAMVFLLKPINDLQPAHLTLSFLPNGGELAIDYKYFLIFFAGGLVCSTLEVVVSFVMEKLFNMRWWDYTNYRFNLHGRACLSIGALWGMMSVIVITFLHPYLVQLPLSFVDKKVMYIIMLVGYSVLLVDTIFSGIMASKLSSKVQFLSQLKEEMELIAERSVKENATEVVDKIKSSKVSSSVKELQGKVSDSELIQRIKDRHAEIVSQITNGESRFFKARPDIELGDDKSITDELKESAVEKLRQTALYKLHNKESRRRSKSKKEPKD